VSKPKRLHVLAADLEIKTVRILDVKTVLGIGLRLKSATLQLSLNRILVPVLDGVSNMIDPRRRASLRGVAGNHDNRLYVLRFMLPPVIGLAVGRANSR
jgi:hypothetical protein